MHWPERPVEQIDPSRFVPPHCPWSSCPSHADGGFRFRRHGVFIRRCDRRVVPRFRCLCCRRTCSLQTFAFSYYLKRSELAEPVAAGLLAGSAHRQLARSLGCAPSSVTRLSARLGRHALLLLARGLDRLPALSEPIVYDDFETFFVSQDLPCGLGTAVGQESWFVYGLEHAPHRRAGRPRPPRKAAPRHAIPSPATGAYRDAFRRMVDLLGSKSSATRPLVLVTDDHPAYRSALRDHPGRPPVIHRIFPNPSRRPSPQARRRDREMFPVDLLHSLLRHSLAHHRRETIAFGRRLNALLERARSAVPTRPPRRCDSAWPASPGTGRGCWRNGCFRGAFLYPDLGSPSIDARSSPRRSDPTAVTDWSGPSDMERPVKSSF
jgi:hypothetical protein